MKEAPGASFFWQSTISFLKAFVFLMNLQTSSFMKIINFVKNPLL